MKILEDYNKFAFELLIEDDEASGRIDMDEPLMQKKGWYKDNPELTIGGVLKQGEKHPAYKDAMQLVNREKGKDSGEDDSKKLSGKSDFSRDGGDDKPKTPSADDYDSIYGTRNQSGGGFQKPRSDDDGLGGEYVPDTKNAGAAKKELVDFSIDLETHEGDIPKSIKQRMNRHTQDIMATHGIYKNKDGQFATDDGKALSDDSVNKMLSRETGRSENEIGYMLNKAGLSQGDDYKSKNTSGDSKEAPKEEPTFRDLKSQFKSDELEKVPFGRDASEEAQDMEEEIADELTSHYSNGGEDEEMFDVVTGESEKLVAKYQRGNVAPSKRNLKDYRNQLIKNIENRRAQMQGKPIVHKGEKTSDKKSRGTMGSVGVREPGQAGSGMYDSVQPKKKPFLKEQLERFGGLK